MGIKQDIDKLSAMVTGHTARLDSLLGQFTFTGESLRHLTANEQLKLYLALSGHWELADKRIARASTKPKTNRV